MKQRKLSAVPKKEPEQPAEHPLLTEAKKIGEEMAVYGIPWGFGVGVNTSEMKPAVEARAAAQILIQKGICTAEEWDTMVYTVLVATMRQVLDAVKAQRSRGPGLVLPDGTPVPPDLMPRRIKD